MKANTSYNYCPTSEHTYRTYYNEFRAFMEMRGISDIDDGLRACFQEWSNHYKASSLSCRLSGVKGIMLKDGVAFQESTMLYIQRCISNMQRASPPPKQADAFTIEDFKEYLSLDHQDNWGILLKKMVLIIGVFCLLRGRELRALTRDAIRVCSYYCLIPRLMLGVSIFIIIAPRQIARERGLMDGSHYGSIRYQL